MAGKESDSFLQDVNAEEVRKELVAYRLGSKLDHPFLYSSWLQGLYYGNETFREIEKSIYFENYHKVIQAILERPCTKILIACLKDEPEAILSYAVVEMFESHHVLHWIFTKPAWRKIGLAKQLIIAEAFKYTVTHLTKVGRSLKPKEWVFNPFLI